MMEEPRVLTHSHCMMLFALISLSHIKPTLNGFVRYSARCGIVHPAAQIHQVYDGISMIRCGNTRVSQDLSVEPMIEEVWNLTIESFPRPRKVDADVIRNNLGIEPRANQVGWERMRLYAQIESASQSRESTPGYSLLNSSNLILFGGKQNAWLPSTNMSISKHIMQYLYHQWTCTTTFSYIRHRCFFPCKTCGLSCKQPTINSAPQTNLATHSHCSS